MSTGKLNKKILIVNHETVYHTIKFIENLSKNKNLKISLLTHSINKEFFENNSFDFSTINVIKYKYFTCKFNNSFCKYLFMLINIFYFSCTVLFKIEKQDFIEIHFPDIIILPLIIFKNKLTRKLGIYFWGDDLVLINSIFKKIIIWHKNNIDYYIVGSKKFIEILTQKISVEKRKINLINFGVSSFDYLKKEIHNKLKFKKDLHFPLDKIVLTIGNNAHERQDHIKIIQTINSLSIADKAKLHLFIPLSYPSNVLYIQTVIRELKKSGFSYSYIDHFVSEQEICKYRIVSDIYLNMQNFDAFSLAMSEYFYVNCIVINAEWLHYQEIIDNGGNYLSVNYSSLNNLLTNLINNKIDINEFSKNQTVIYNLKSWNTQILKWFELYEKDNFQYNF